MAPPTSTEPTSVLSAEPVPTMPPMFAPPAPAVSDAAPELVEKPPPPEPVAAATPQMPEPRAAFSSKLAELDATPGPSLGGGLGTSGSRSASPRRSLLGGLSSVGSAIKRTLSGRGTTQLDDFAEFKYNEKYKAWIPGNVDPDDWAKENLAAPPPPPTASSTPKLEDTPTERNGVSSTPHSSSETPSVPQTPVPGLPQAPSAGGGRFSARGGSSRRAPARSRYVDTFNTDGGDTPAESSTGLMPPPPARPKAPPMNIFTPGKPAAGTETYQTPTQRVDDTGADAKDD